MFFFKKKLYSKMVYQIRTKPVYTKPKPNKNNSCLNWEIRFQSELNKSTSTQIEPKLTINRDKPITFIHILVAIEYNDVIITHDLQSDKHFLVFFSQVTEHKLHVDLNAGGNILRAVDHPEKMPTWVLIGKCKNPNKYPNLIII